MPRVVPSRVFDAWSWCESDELVWRTPRAIDLRAQVTSDNPPGLVFVMQEAMHDEAAEVARALPRELARLHALGYGLDDDAWALAPYAIDDATDLLYARRTRPRDVLWLAAPSLPALVWGLHDWAHFHNHGPFDEVAMTELQCDLVALAWLRLNRAAIGLDDAALERVARDLAALSRARFAAEEAAPPFDDLEATFLGPYPSCGSRTEAPAARRVIQA